MKKNVFLILSTLSFCTNAQSINLDDITNFGNQMRDRFSPPQEVQKRTSFPTCTANVINETTGKITRSTVKLIGQHSQKGTEHTYHEEDDTGSTTVWFDSRTGKGQISIMDTSKVIASGTVSNCK